MTEKLQINTRVKRLTDYIEEIDNGYIQIPSFQRDFIWDNTQKRELFESISLGFPIGSLLLWKPKDEYGTTDKIGPFLLPQPRKYEYHYVLDGFQRLSTIYGCLKNPKKTKSVDEELRLKEYAIFYDLIKEEFFVPRSENVALTQIPVYTLVDTFEFLTFANQLQNEYPDKEEALKLLEKAQKITTIFSDYTLPGIEIGGGKIKEAIEIFTRINSKGSTITTDWMLSALTNNEKKDFNLGSLINELINDLEIFNFGSIKRELIVQCIQNSFGKVFFDTKIEDLYQRKDFIPNTHKTIESIKKAVLFLYKELSVLTIKLLPYNNQLIFITDFFNHIPQPTQKQIDDLKQWFWQTTYANYFTIYSLSKIREAYKQFRRYLEGATETILYNDKPDKPFTVIDFPNKIFFGSVRAKALVLFLLNYSNEFKNIEPDINNKFHLFNLYNVRNEAGNYPPEGTIPVVLNTKTKSTLNDLLEDKTKKRKTIDFSGFLTKEAYNKKLELYFLTENMIGKTQSEVFAIRKREIISKERKFVENLELQYE